MKHILKYFLITIFTLTFILQGCTSVKNKNLDVEKEMPNTAIGFEAGNIINNGIACSNGEWVFYTDTSQSNLVIKMQNDGTEKSVLARDHSDYLNVINDTLYYVNHSDNDKIYSINTNSTERKKISDDAASNLYVIDDVIFYTNQSDYQNIYRVNTNGDNNELLVDFQYEPQCSEAMIADENWIYYFDKPYHRLHRMDFDGRNVFDYAKDIGYNVNIS